MRRAIAISDGRSDIVLAAAASWPRLAAATARAAPRRRRAAGGRRAWTSRRWSPRCRSATTAAADFRARFTQTLTSAAMGRKTSSSGEVMFKKPGRMRWDYEKPDKSSYVTDGGVLWLYEPDDKQAFKQELEGVAAAGGAGVPDRQGEAGDRVRHRVRRQVAYGDAGRLRAVAVAQGAAAAGQDDPVRRRSAHLRRARERHHRRRRGTSTTSCSPTSASTRACPDALFKFTPPAGTRVIDTAKLGK